MSVVGQPERSGLQRGPTALLNAAVPFTRAADGILGLKMLQEHQKDQLGTTPVKCTSCWMFGEALKFENY